ncbi:hypothetical protein GIB67_012034 [Kingdonia uniflora]|uniref:Sugar phosphate transporter domain-containing protein n=1 Tax=Kingdonia uniflora TaxID=39325 RepID=A0A7J7M066_9MAGN|nr:hypothetical protein GIB67_012034 [Kingdonia uniflora]
MLCFDMRAKLIAILFGLQVLKVFPFPVTITTFQFAIGTTLVLFMWIFNLYKRPKITSAQLVAILLLAIVHTMGNLFTNMSLGKVVASLTYTIKAMEPFFSLPRSLRSLAFCIWMPTFWVVLCLVPIAGGVALASISEASFNWIGFWSTMASNVIFQSPNVLSKKIMVNKKKSMDNITLFSVITIMSLFLLTPVALFMEGVKFTPTYLQVVGLNAKDICIKALVAGICFHAYQQVRHSSGYCIYLYFTSD